MEPSRCDASRAPQAGWQLDDLYDRSPLAVDGETAVTTDPIHGRLVRIVDDGGTVISNRAVVDDPDALDAMLHARDRSTDDRPPELLSGDLDTPLGNVLIWLHRNLVMDVTERASPGAGSGGVGSGESDSAADDKLWNRLEHEKLGRDPRAHTYGRLLGRPTGLGASEPILELLETMRDRAPSPERTVESGRSVLTVLREQAEQAGDEDPGGGDDNAPIKRWKTETRIRVRARNVLRRWAAAQTDPRLVWIDTLAPAGNFSMVASTFARLWVTIGKDPSQCELRADDLDDLWLDWMRPFAGTGRGDGWLDQLEQSDSRVSDRLPADLPETVAALSWLALHNKDRETIIAWQPVLSAALGHGLLEPSEETARFVSHVTHWPVDRSAVESDLLRCIEFIDDNLWCKRTRDELALKDLRLEEVTGGQAVSVRLVVKGLVHPLRDPPDLPASRCGSTVSPLRWGSRLLGGCRMAPGHQDRDSCLLSSWRRQPLDAGLRRGARRLDRTDGIDGRHLGGPLWSRPGSLTGTASSSANRVMFATAFSHSGTVDRAGSGLIIIGLPFYRPPLTGSVSQTIFTGTSLIPSSMATAQRVPCEE